MTETWLALRLVLWVHYNIIHRGVYNNSEFITPLEFSRKKDNVMV